MWKGQSAIEYLATYGWMLLVVAIVAGALFSTVYAQVPVEASNLASDDLSIENVDFTRQGSLLLGFKNEGDESMELNSVSLNGSELFTGSGGPTIPALSQGSIEIPGIERTDNRQNLELSLTFSKGELEVLQTSGKIKGHVDVTRSAEATFAQGSYSKIEASGGDHILESSIDDKLYKIHVFNATGSDSFSVEKSLNGQVDILVVAGGGGGGGRHGAGGGAGGVVFKQRYSVAAKKYQVRVGSGGDGGNGNGETGEQGENSVFGDLTAIGGGAGHGADDASGDQDGGSGGGTNSYEGNTAGNALQPESSTGGFGRDGGDTSYGEDSPYNHAGGGGAAQKGGDGTLSSPGYGGKGIYYGDKFTERFGENGYFAGGGGGGSHGPTPDEFNNTGGLGGGGDGGATPYDQSTGSGGTGDDGDQGMAATGGGGGGGSTDSSSGGSGGDGGSGIVLIRYPIDQ
jgi:hypothetical protein